MIPFTVTQDPYTFTTTATTTTSTTEAATTVSLAPVPFCLNKGTVGRFPVVGDPKCQQ
jgi:hypothetical protein